MKKSFKSFFAVILSLTLILSAVFSASVITNAAAADVVLSASPEEVLPEAILNAGQPVRDASKFNADGHDTVTSDGHTFAHAGAGDKFSFTVDFGTLSIDKMSFTVPVLRGTSFALNVYVDGSSVGTTSAVTASGGAGSISFSSPLNGVHKIEIEVVSDKNVWPGDDWGYVTFSSSVIKMTSKSFEVPASSILAVAEVTRDASRFDNGGHINVEASGDGKVFWHSGTGDKFTFKMDFGSYVVDSFSFGCDARGPMSLKLYDGSNLIAAAACSDFSGKGSASLSTELTGVHTISIEVDSDATAWPGPDYGYITFTQTKIIMTSEVYALSAADILGAGTVTRDSSKFDNGGHTDVLASDDGQYFWHSGNGDAFEFDIDLGSYKVNRVKFNAAVRGPMSVDIYDGNELVGTASVSENSGDGIAELTKTLTGKKTLKLVISCDAVVWPGPDWGAIELSYEPETTAPETTEPETVEPETTEPETETPVAPQTGDMTIAMFAIAAVVTLAAIAVFKKRAAS